MAHGALGARSTPTSTSGPGRRAYRVEVEAALGDGAIWMTFFDNNARYGPQWRAGPALARAPRLLASGKFDAARYKRDRLGARPPLLRGERPATSPRSPSCCRSTPRRPRSPPSRSCAPIRIALDVLAEVPDPLPEPLREAHDLVGLAPGAGVDPPARWTDQQDRAARRAAEVRRGVRDAGRARAAPSRAARPDRGQPRTGARGRHLRRLRRPHALRAHRRSARGRGGSCCRPRRRRTRCTGCCRARSARARPWSRCARCCE